MTHLATTRNPQSEARRQHIHGKLIITDDPQSTREKMAWCALYVTIMVLGIGLSLHFGVS